MTTFKNPEDVIQFDMTEQDPLGASVAKSIRVLSKKDGWLECRSCPTPTFWCQHVRHIVTKALDADCITGPRLSEIVSHRAAWVPVFPETFHLFGRVATNGVVKNVNAVKAYFIPDGMPDELTAHFLGFLHRGEGRNVLRSMLLDTALAVVRDAGETTTCESSSHGFTEEIKWQQSLKAPESAPERIAQAFSLLNTRMCLGCSDPINAPDDDLIPR